MKIHILQGARQDLTDAYRFYERNESGLGKYFLTSISADIESLIVYAGIHPIKFNEYHCMFSKRFPFAVYYTLKGEMISEEAVLDCRQNPKGTIDRLVE